MPILSIYLSYNKVDLILSILPFAHKLVIPLPHVFDICVVRYRKPT